MTRKQKNTGEAGEEQQEEEKFTSDKQLPRDGLENQALEDFLVARSSRTHQHNMDKTDGHGPEKGGQEPFIGWRTLGN